MFRENTAVETARSYKERICPILLLTKSPNLKLKTLKSFRRLVTSIKRGGEGVEIIDLLAKLLKFNISFQKNLNLTFTPKKLSGFQIKLILMIPLVTHNIHIQKKAKTSV